MTLPEQPPQALPPGYAIKPVVGNPNVKFTLETPDGSGYALGATTAEQAYPNALAVLHDKGVLPPPQNFHSGHFDEPNILVHTRANERTLPTGERGRFVEEVQSDWHQKGKQQGYAQPSDQAAIRAAVEKQQALEDELRQLQPRLHAAHAADDPVTYPPLSRERDRLQSELAQATMERRALMEADVSAVPDAPFKEILARPRPQAAGAGDRRRPEGVVDRLHGRADAGRAL